MTTQIPHCFFMQDDALSKYVTVQMLCSYELFWTHFQWSNQQEAMETIQICEIFFVAVACITMIVRAVCHVWQVVLALQQRHHAQGEVKVYMCMHIL